MASRNDVHWLTSDQQKAWRAYIMGTELLNHQLDRELREEHQISFSEYEILVRLSEAEGGRMRMAILADAMSHSRSRVTHTIARMERADLVVREASRVDGRGVEAVMTAEGRRVLIEAAPTHVRGVREHLVDLASKQDFAALGRIFDEVSERLLAGKPEEADIRWGRPRRPRGGQSPVSRRCVTRCGRAASAPRRSILFSSYAAKLPSNQNHLASSSSSPSQARMWVATRSRNHRSWEVTTAQPGYSSRASSSEESVSTSRSLVGSSRSSRLPPIFRVRARLRRLRSPPESTPAFFCWSGPLKPNDAT